MRSPILLPIFALLLAATFASAQTSNVKKNQTIVFFPGFGHRETESNGWVLEIHGCVYEPEKRAVELMVIRAALGLDRVKMNAAETATFKERARLFMVDDKGGRKVVVRIGQKDYAMNKTTANGHFSGTVRLGSEEFEKLRTGPGGSRIDFYAATPDGRVFRGVVDVVEDAGVTVISDIDDTIKITEVLNRPEMLRRTFLEPFEAVPGMSAAYRDWAKAPGTQFHYVSASPWQLYLPLDGFIRSNRFPDGTFYLRDFRVKDRSFFSVFESPQAYKLEVIEPLLKMFPNRRFVLVGDSGERDPEAYSILARKYPRQVAAVYIHNVTHEGPEAARFQKDFEGLPATLWKVFDDPAQLTGGGW